VEESQKEQGGSGKINLKQALVQVSGSPQGWNTEQETA